MTTTIFVNLPVADLERSKAFFGGLGYRFNPQFTDDKAACLVISDTIYAMLLKQEFFATFLDKPVADALQSSEVLVALGVESRDAVTSLCEKAFALGARKYKEPDDLGFMFSWGFEDLDGHVWECLWMDPAHIQAPPEA